MAPKAQVVSRKRPAALAPGAAAPPAGTPKRRAAEEATAPESAAPGDSAAVEAAATPGGGLQDVLTLIRSGLAVGGGRDGQQAALRGVAEALMNHWDLWIGGQSHCIAELEAYVHAPTHQDPYTHGDTDQERCGVWYFHRKGGSFKGGSFKGLDLACGDGGGSVIAGLLLRSVRPLNNGVAGDVLEGPCLLVDRILELNGKPSIVAFVSGRRAAELSAEVTEGLCMKPATAPRSDKVWPAPRVGLVLRKHDAQKTHMSGGSPADFVARFYRFSTAPRQLSKFRSGFAVAAYLGSDVSPATLATELGMAKVEEYTAAADRGVASGAPDRFADRKINTQPELCELVGACLAAARKGS